MNSKTHSTGTAGEAIEASVDHVDAPDICDVIERLWRAIYFTEIASMAADSMDDSRIQSAFAVTLQQISDELNDAHRELKVILQSEGGAA